MSPSRSVYVATSKPRRALGLRVPFTASQADLVLLLATASGLTLDQVAREGASRKNNRPGRMAREEAVRIILRSLTQGANERQVHRMLRALSTCDMIPETEKTL